MAATRQYNRIFKLASSCRFPVSDLPLIVLSHLKSNWHLAATYQVPIHKNLQILSGCRLSDSYIAFVVFNPLYSNLHLAAVANTQELGIWHLAAVCWFPIYPELS